MANLAKSAVTVNDWWYEGNRVGSKRKVLDVTLVLTGQGGNDNTIPASIFGLRKISSASSAINSADQFVLLPVPSFDATKLFMCDTSDSSAPVDMTGTYRLTIWGKE